MFLLYIYTFLKIIVECKKNDWSRRNQMIENQNVDFNIIISNLRKNKYRYIGSGSGRRVFDLENGYVVKVAKNQKGIAQNKVEYQIASEDHTNHFAKITHVTNNYQLLIMEKAVLINNITIVWKYFDVRNNKEFYQLEWVNDILSKHDLLFVDLCRPANWGIIDNHPIIIDYGFTSSVKKKYYFPF
jgi:hypothetical protein